MFGPPRQKIRDSSEQSSVKLALRYEEPSRVLEIFTNGWYNAIPKKPGTGFGMLTLR